MEVATTSAGFGRVGFGLDEKDGRPELEIPGVMCYVRALDGQAIQKPTVSPAQELPPRGFGKPSATLSANELADFHSWHDYDIRR